jgi:signal recognition particle subunit SRP54
VPVLDALSQKFETILRKLRGQGVLTEANIAEALKEVRRRCSKRM